MTEAATLIQREERRLNLIQGSVYVKHFSTNVTHWELLLLIHKLNGDPKYGLNDYIDSLRTLSLCTNLGDTKTLLTHPASTSHGRLSEANRQLAGIQQSLVRVAVGLEHLDDLKNDLSRGLDLIKATA